MPDAGDALRDRNARQAGAAIKGGFFDVGNPFRNVVFVSCLACRISMQHGLLFIEQNPIHNCVIRVPCANLNRSQAGAANEGTSPDASNAVRNRNTC